MNMAEWSLLFNGLEKVVVVAIAIIGFLIRKHLAAQDLVNIKVGAKLEEILKEVRRTNGRVGVLEDWRGNHVAETTRVQDRLETKAQHIENRLNQFIDRSDRGTR